jgi:TM2 domain-containing membrane protein YozV
MRKITLSKWVISILVYAIVIYFGSKGIESYYMSYIVTNSKMNDLQTTSFVGLILLCSLSSYNFLSYSKRYLKGIIKKKRR